MYMVKMCAMGGASQDVFLSGKGIKAEIDASSDDNAEMLRLGVKLNIDRAVFSSGGGATNAAVTFARQDLETSFIGKLGYDVAAESVIKELDHENVDSRLVVYDNSKGTQYSTVLLAESGERTILVYRGVSNTHKVADYQDIDFSEFDYLYVSSFGGAMEALDYIFTQANQAGVKIAFNPGEAELKHPQKLKALLDDVEVLIVNREEAQKIVDGDSLEELVRRLLNLVPLAIVSDGPNGLVASDKQIIVRAGMYEDVAVLDRTGAGDAFGSGFFSQWAQGLSLKDAVIFGSANSTSVVTKIGSKAGILKKGVKLHDMPLEEKPF